MQNLSLKAEKRNKEENNKLLRSSKLIPCVVYWHSQEPISLKLDYSDFLKTYRISSNSHIINLDAWWKKMDVIVSEVQKNPITWDYIHVDFYAITKWEKLTTNIKVVFEWTSPAIKEWAVLEELLKEIEVKCLAKDLVDNFQADLSLLKEIWDSLKVEDLWIDESKFDILTNHDEIVVIAWKPAKLVVETQETAEVEETEETENKE